MTTRSTKKPKGALAAAEQALRAHAMKQPDATEHFPWGERAIKIKGKVFLFMYADAERLRDPASVVFAVEFDFEVHAAAAADFHHIAELYRQLNAAGIAPTSLPRPSER